MLQSGKIELIIPKSTYKRKVKNQNQSSDEKDATYETVRNSE